MPMKRTKPAAVAMPRVLTAILGTLGVSAGLAFGAGCDDEEPFFKSCPLSTSIVELCREDQPNTELTCLVTQHPMCVEGVCATWEGSGTFCSRTCTDTADCPPESACLPYLDGSLSICVPDERPEPGQLTP